MIRLVSPEGIDAVKPSPKGEGAPLPVDAAAAISSIEIVSETS